MCDASQAQWGGAAFACQHCRPGPPRASLRCVIRTAFTSLYWCNTTPLCLYYHSRERGYTILLAFNSLPLTFAASMPSAETVIDV